jgi:hypothetical protein
VRLGREAGRRAPAGAAAGRQRGCPAHGQALPAGRGQSPQAGRHCPRGMPRERQHGTELSAPGGMWYEFVLGQFAYAVPCLCSLSAIGMALLYELGWSDEPLYAPLAISTAVLLGKWGVNVLFLFCWSFLVVALRAPERVHIGSRGSSPIHRWRVPGCGARGYLALQFPSCPLDATSALIRDRGHSIAWLAACSHRHLKRLWKSHKSRSIVRQV